MCTVKKPKTPETKPPVYMTNPLLSGLAIGGGTGRDSLRSDLTIAQAGPSEVVRERDNQQLEAQREIADAQGSLRGARGFNKLFYKARLKKLTTDYEREF